MNAQPVYLASKPHYEILDGLRGGLDGRHGMGIHPASPAAEMGRAPWDVRRWLTDRFLKRVKTRQ